MLGPSGVKELPEIWFFVVKQRLRGSNMTMREFTLFVVCASIV